MKKVIITGATGFIGTALSKRLLDLGVEVIALSRSLDVPESLCANEKYQHVCMDVNDISKLETMPINISNVDAFIHLAWGGTSGEGRRDINLQNKNIEMTMNCFAFAKKIQCGKFVFAGTIQEDEIDYAKDHPTLINPSLIYGSAKKYAHYLCEFSPRDDMEVCTLKITNIFGPGENTPRFINTTIRKLLKKEPLQFSASTQNYDFIYLDDAVDAIIGVAEKGIDNKEYVIGSGGAKPLKEFIYEMIALLDSSAVPNFSNIEGLSLDKSFYDITPLVEDIGWKPKKSFKEGIELTADWIKNNL